MKVKFHTNTDTSLIRHRNVAGTSHVRDTYSLEQNTPQISAYRHSHSVNSKNMKAPEEHNTMNVTMKNRNKINKVNKVIYVHVPLAQAA